MVKSLLKFEEERWSNTFWNALDLVKPGVNFILLIAILGIGVFSKVEAKNIYYYAEEKAASSPKAPVAPCVLPNLTIGTVQTDASCGLSNGAIALSVVGTFTTVSATVSNTTSGSVVGTASGITSGTTNFTGLAAGNYDVEVVDILGCDQTMNVTVGTAADATPPVVSVYDTVEVAIGLDGKHKFVYPDLIVSATDDCALGATTYSPKNIKCNSVGNFSTITVRQADASGNITTNTVVVKAVDVTPPEANFYSPIVIQLDENGEAFLYESSVDSLSYDNCSSPIFSLSKWKFNCSDMPSSSVTVTIEDAAGNSPNDSWTQVQQGNNLVYVKSDVSDSWNITVFIDDCLPPVTMCKDIELYLDETGIVNVDPLMVNDGSFDNCGLWYYTLDDSVFTCNDTGANATNLHAYDLAGNVSCCPLNVVIRDTIDPVAVCQDIIAYVDSNGYVLVKGEDLDGGTTGNCQVESFELSDTSFSCTNVGQGPITVEMTAVDNNGNSSKCNSLVTVIDTIKPEITCKNLTVYLDQNGEANIVSNDLIDNVWDNCTVASYTLSKTSFNCSDIGTASVQVTVSDISGNTSICTCYVTVADTLAPALSCKDITAPVASNGYSKITVQDVVQSLSDNCGLASVTLSDSIFDCTMGGVYNVTITATDIYNNVSTCISKVTVVDKPVAKCKDTTIYIGTSGSFTLSASDLDDGSFFNCGLDTIYLSKTHFDCSDAGVNYVDVIASDGQGNYDTCTSTVTVLDTIAPKFVSCQCDVIRPASLGNCDAYVQMQCPVIVDDNCANLTVVNDYNGTNDASDTYPVGVTVINWTVTDPAGNTGTYQQVVLIIDTEDPQVVCTPDMSVSNDPGNCSAQLTVASPTATDNCGIKFIANNISGFAPLTYTFPVGTTTVEWIVEDDNGNFVKCYTDVTVVDDEAPAITCAADLTVTPNPGSCNANVTVGQPTTGDNCGVASVVNDYNGTADASDSYPGGSTIVTWTVTDVNGNTATCQQTITVIDSENPIAVCKNITVALDANGDASITTADIDNGSSDNCSIASISLSQTDFDCSDVGSNSVTMTVTDASGNSSTCTATVTVTDVTAPIALCKNITVALNPSGQANITAADIDNGSSDACGIATMTVSNTSFDCSNLGTNTVTFTVTDNNGNTSNCTSTVTVEDNTAPVVSCKDITVALDVNGNASITASSIDNGSTDNCGIASLTINNSSFSCTDAGVNQVTLTATDASGNTSTCTANVTVVDNLQPVALCKNITIQLDANGEASISVSDIDFGSYDNCGSISYALSQTDFDCSDLGNNILVFTVTDGNGNTSICNPTVTVEDNTDPTISNIPSNITTTGNCNPSVSWTPPTADDNCSVTLTSTHNPGDNFPVGTTTVTYTATDGSGNSVQESFTVTVVASPLVVTTTVSQFNGGYNVSCYGANDGSATVNVTGGCEPYTYSWSNSQTTETIVNLTAGTYTVTVTDNNGDTKTVTVTLTEPTQVSASVVGTDVTCGGSVVDVCTVSKYGSSGHAIWLPNLANGVSNKFLFANGGGTLTQYPNGTAHLTGEIYNANDANKGFEVSVWFANKRDWAQWSALGRDYKDEANVAGNNYEDWFYYEMDANKSNTLTGVNDYAGDVLNLTHKPSNLKFGFQVGLAANSKDADYGMSGWFMYTGSWSGHGDFNFDGSCSSTTQCDGAATVTASGGVGPYTYAWSSGGSDVDEDNLCAGTYSVTVTDANGCSTVESVTINAPSQINLTISKNDATCSSGTNGSASVSVSGGNSPYTYYWSTGATTSSINNLTPGVYSVTVTDANGCKEIADVTVGRPACCNVTSGGSIGNPQANCGSFDPSTITNVVLPSGGLGTIEYVWLYSYVNVPNTVGNPHWTPIPNSDASTYDPGVVTQTTYFMRCARRVGCTPWAGESNVITMTVNPAPSISAVVNSNVSCNGANDGSATVSVASGASPYSYYWTGGATSATASSLSAGTYTVTVTDANGCTATTSVTITEPAQLAASASYNDATCSTGTDGSASVSASGGTTPYSYLWSNSATTASISNLSSGTYTVTVTDANNCQQTASVTITRPACCNVTAAGSIGNGQSNCGPFNPSTITNVASPSGGLGNIEYIWLSSTVNVPNTSGNPYWNIISGATSATYNPGSISQTTYYLRCSRRAGCTAWVGESNVVAMVVNPAPTATTQLVSNVSCNGGNDGVASVTGSAGTAPYTYLWSNNSTSQQVTGLSAGTYSVTVTDANGCDATATITITEPNTLALSGSVEDVSCYGNADGEIDLTVTGGTSPYSYSWTGGGNNQDLSGLSLGTYTVTVTDNNGCTANKTFSVNEPAVLAATSSVTDALCSNVDNGAIDVTMSGGTTPYSYSWVGTGNYGATTQDISSLGSGVYTLTVTDANGCTVSLTDTIDQSDPIIVTGVVTDANCNGYDNGSIDITVSGGNITSGTSNLWVENFEDNNLYATSDNGSTAWSKWNNNNNNYSKVVSGNSGKVFESSNGDAKWYSEEIDISSAQDVEVSVDLGSCQGNYLESSGSYVDYVKVYYSLDGGSWTLFSTNSVTYGEISGVITASTSNLSGSTLEVKVWMHSTASNESYFVDDVTVTGTVQTSSLSYLWSNNETTQDVSGLGAGTYSVTVTDNNGCSATETFTVTEPSVISTTASITEVSCNSADSVVISVDDYNGSRSFYLPGLAHGNEPNWTLTNGQLVQYADGTAHLTGSLTNNLYSTKQFDCDFWFDNKSSWASWDAQGNDWKGTAATVGNNYQDWSYYDFHSTKSSKLIGKNYYSGTTLTCTQFPVNGTYGLQVGYAANDKDADYGLSTWFTFSGGGFYGQGDINSDCSVPAGSACDGVIDLSVSGGTGPYTYNWSNDNENTQDLSGVCAGNYTVTVTDANGCYGVFNYTVTESSCCNVTDGGTIASNQSDCGPFDPAAFTSSNAATGGSGSLEYVWYYSTTSSTYSAGSNDWAAISSSNMASYNPGMVNTTTYFVRLAKRSSCPNFAGVSNVVTAEINAGPQPSITEVANPSCNGGVGVLEGSFAGTAGPITHKWLYNGQALGSTTTTYHRVCYSSHDAEENSSGQVSTTYSDLIMSSSKKVGLKFNNMQIPQGATITNAYIRFRPYSSKTGVTHLDIYGNDVDDASSFSTSNNNISGRTKTSSKVDWDYVESWYAGNYYYSPDISDVVQELTSRNGWVSGNDLAILIEGSYGCRNAYSYDGSSSYAPKLYVEYTTSPGLTLNNASIGTYQLIGIDANGCTDTVSYTLQQATPMSLTASIVDATGTVTSCNLDMSNLSNGEEIDNQFSSDGVTISANSNGSYVDELIVFDTDLSGTRDSDLEVNIGNILIFPENTTDNNNDGLYDYPDDQAVGGSICMTFNIAKTVKSFKFVDSENNQGRVKCYDASNTLLSTTTIANAGDGSVQTVNVNTQGVKKMVITFTTSGGVTDFRFECPSTSNCDGSIDLSVAGGTAPYTYSWGQGQTTQDLSNLCPGVHTVTVTDSKGCSEIKSFTVGTATSSSSSRAVKADKVQHTSSEPVNHANDLRSDVSNGIALSPNPANVASTVNYTVSETATVAITVNDMTGKELIKVYTGQVQGGVMNSAPINLEDLRSGIYQVVIISSNGEHMVERIVVSR